MTRGKLIQVTLLAGAALLMLWQFQCRISQNRLYAQLQDQIETESRKLAGRQPVLDEWEQRNRALQNRRIETNSSLGALVRQRAALTSTTATARQAAQAERNRVFRSTLADTLDNPQQKEINRGLLKNELRAYLASRNQKLNLAPDQLEQIVNLLTEDELKKTDRLAALLRGQLPVAEALEERNAAYHELQTQLRSILGEEGYAVYDEGRQTAAKSQADRDVTMINSDLGANAMDAAQTDQLRALIRAEVYGFIADDTDAFRSEEDWHRFYNLVVEKIAGQAATFLTAVQVNGFRKLAAADLVENDKALAAKRKGYGL
jgi:hypothetical protein